MGKFLSSYTVKCIKVLLIDLNPLKTLFYKSHEIVCEKML